MQDFVSRRGYFKGYLMFTRLDPCIFCSWLNGDLNIHQFLLIYLYMIRMLKYSLFLHFCQYLFHI